MSDFAETQEFLKTYKFRSVDAELTLMDIAGFPHCENVYSNILAFLLDTGEVHGFDQLFIRSIMAAYHGHCRADWWSDSLDPKSVKAVEATDSIEREFITKSKNRIDILIECAGFLVCIENKIWSDLPNDLRDYRKCCEDIPPRRPVLGIVLSPHGITDEKLKKKLEDHRFVSITYGDLAKQVRQRMGYHIGPHNTRYQYLLFDFLEQASRFTFTMTDDQKEFLQLWEDDKKILNILQRWDKMYKKLHEKAKAHCNQCSEGLNDSTPKVFGEPKVWPGRASTTNTGGAIFSYFDLAKKGDYIDECQIFLDVEFRPHSVIHVLGDRRLSRVEPKLIDRISKKCGITFECDAYPDCHFKTIIKRLEKSPFEEPAYTKAVDTSIEILRAIAAISAREKG